jgi:hypothetical protein
MRLQSDRGSRVAASVLRAPLELQRRSSRQHREIESVPAGRALSHVVPDFGGMLLFVWVGCLGLGKSNATHC